MKKEKIEEKTATILQSIAKRRHELGISQFDLALKLNLTNNGYFKVEKGYTSLSVSRLLEIAEILDIHPASFFEDF